MSSLSMRSLAGTLAGAVAALWLTPAHPHAVCGARIFPATIAIDDPGVLDELTLPTVSWVPYNSDSAHEWDASFSWTKTITPSLSVVIGSGPTGSTQAATAGTRSTPSCSGRRCASQTPSS